MNKFADDFYDTTPDVPTSPQFIATREQVMRQMLKAKRSGITYGYLSRRISRENVCLLDAVIADLSADGLVRFDPTQCAPSRIFPV